MIPNLIQLTNPLALISALPSRFNKVHSLQSNVLYMNICVLLRK